MRSPFRISGKYASSMKLRSLGGGAFITFTLTSALAMKSSPEYENKTGQKYIQQRKRQQNVPSETHQLIIPKTRKRPADQHEEPEEKCEFDKEGNHLQNRDPNRSYGKEARTEMKSVLQQKRNLPSTEEKNRY